MWLAAVQQTAVTDRATPSEWSIADLGCGDEKLFGAIAATSVPFRYQGYDLIPQTASCLKLDLLREHPPAYFDTTFVLGVIEYLPSPAKFIKRLSRTCRWAVVSYVAADSGAYRPEEWAARGWKHHLTTVEMAEVFARSGFQQLNSSVLDSGRTYLWLLESTPR